MLARMTQTSSSISKAPSRTKPIMMNIRGIQIIVYSSMDN